MISSSSRPPLVVGLEWGDEDAGSGDLVVSVGAGVGGSLAVVVVVLLAVWLCFRRKDRNVRCVCSLT